MISSLFITKNPAEIGELQQFAEDHGIALVAKSFLQFKPVKFTLTGNFDVIFFGSPRAVLFFQSRYSIPSNTLIASVGGKTSALLKSMGHDVAFDGANKGSISKVASQFQEWLGDRKVLFPVSTKSLGTVSKGIATKQANHVECYETVISPYVLEKNYDVYVFTSPSNVEGFFTENTLSEQARIIAWGESTEIALKKQIKTSVVTLPHPTFLALIEELKK